MWGQLSSDTQAELDGRDLSELSTDKHYSTIAFSKVSLASE